MCSRSANTLRSVWTPTARETQLPFISRNTMKPRPVHTAAQDVGRLVCDLCGTLDMLDDLPRDPQALPPLRPGRKRSIRLKSYPEYECSDPTTLFVQMFKPRSSFTYVKTHPGTASWTLKAAVQVHDSMHTGGFLDDFPRSPLDCTSASIYSINRVTVDHNLTFARPRNRSS